MPSPCLLRPGDLVRIDPNVRCPHFGFAGVNHTSRGTLLEIKREKKSAKVFVFFPEHGRWMGFTHELILLEDEQSAMTPGRQVQYRKNVKIPRHGWGKLDRARDSIGVIQRQVADGTLVVDFAEESGRIVMNCEVEVLLDSPPLSTLHGAEEQSVISEDQRQPTSQSGASVSPHLDVEETEPTSSQGAASQKFLPFRIGFNARKKRGEYEGLVGI